jgi:dihydroneopterin aldolase
VRDIVRGVNDAESYRLLETLAAAAADALNAELRVERLRVTVRKPGIAWAEWTGVTCERP